MKYVALTTVPDASAADVFGEALKEAGIPFEVKRISPTVYLSSATPASFEVRVAEDRLAEATGLLSLLAEDAEAAALREAAAVAPAEAPTAAPPIGGARGPVRRRAGGRDLRQPLPRPPLGTPKAASRRSRCR
jgi:hypothetical protein